MGQNGKQKRLLRAIQYIIPQKIFLIIILLLTLLVAAANALDPLILKYIFDNLTRKNAFRLILLGLAGLLVLILFKELASQMSNWLSWRTRLTIHHNLLEKTVGKLHSLPLNYQREQGVGAIMTRLDRGIQGFLGAVTEIAFNVLPAIAYLIMSVIIMLQLDLKLTILVLAFTPLPALAASFAAPVQTSREKNLLERWAKIYSRFNEVLSGIVTVRSFAMEDTEKRRFLNDVNNANQVVVRGVRFDGYINGAENIIIALARLSAIGMGGYFVLNGTATLGTLVAFLGYVGGLFGPVQGLTGIYKTLKTASVSIDQVFSILDTQDHLGDAPDAIEAHKLIGQVEFKNVHFSYGLKGRPLLNGINLQVDPGKMVAIVGPTGSGKSTMMALLQRFYDPVMGEISIDGINIKKMKQKSIRRQIGVVLQDALLFNESVKENIAYGRSNARMNEIIKAAKTANADEFIKRLENGYDTNVGERGSRLSMGERQRIAIARAVLKDPPILILDEATSALDAEVESNVQSAIERLLKNRTTFVIAHRLATVVNADLILVLREGKIIESGKHRELLELNGYYSSLVEKQTKGLITI
jgi:ATP-binding cassette subfamily B protein